MKTEIELTELEILILHALTKEYRTTQQIRYILEGKGYEASSYDISRGLYVLVRLGKVTRKMGRRVYKYREIDGE